MGNSRASEILEVDIKTGITMEIKRLNDNKQYASVTINNLHSGYIFWELREQFAEKMKEVYSFYQF